jgi:RecB family endonuclease NucS
MLRIDRAKRSLVRLGQKPFAEAGLLERTDFQQMIRNAPNEFFAELGEKLLLVGEEVRPFPEVVDDRIDLLAIDSEGSTVIIELKRGANKLQLLQALSYAALISDWTRERLIAERIQFSQKTENEIEEEFDETPGRRFRHAERESARYLSS